MDSVILVDENDTEIGSMEKLEAHKQGLLHRAFSILLFNSKGELLIQQRSSEKYHSPNLWTNTCCSHPRPGESVVDAAHRRLLEEMGIQTELKLAFKFTYRVVMDNGLIENEVDYVFTGSFDGNPELNIDEVSDYKYVSVDAIKSDIRINGENYTSWFKLLLSHFSKFE